jgi:putative transposase
MKFGFIARRRSAWPVAWLCEALGGLAFRAWLTRGPGALARGRGDHASGKRELCGESPRPWEVRRTEAGFSCGLHKIERLRRAKTLRRRPVGAPAERRR